MFPERMCLDRVASDWSITKREDSECVSVRFLSCSAKLPVRLDPSWCQNGSLLNAFVQLEAIERRRFGSVTYRILKHLCWRELWLVAKR